MQLFKIVFDNPSESYFAGQVVSGKVHIQLSHSKKVKAVKLKCIGKGEAHWSKQKGKATKYYDAEEYYINSEQSLVDEGNEDTTIPPGNHVYPFAFQLPTGIPSSFQGSKGKIQYFALATVTRSWKFAQKTSSYFTVNGLVDLNTHLTASNPIGLNQSKRLPLLGCLGSCWFCTNSTVGFTLNLDKTGFVPGETIKFNVDVTNESEFEVKRIYAEIIQVATFRVRYHERWNSVKVAQLTGPEVEPEQCLNWQPSDRVLRVPAVPPTSLGGGTIIGLEYFLEICLRVDTFCDTRVTARVPIIIGTIPFRNTFAELMPASRFNHNQSNLVSTEVAGGNDGLPSYGTLAIPLSLEGYPDLPPPTYTEAMDLFDKYGSSPPPPLPVLTFDELDARAEDERSEVSEADEAGSGRPFLPRYATYGWSLA